jgi:DNA-binding CsgD family transcriptional regulator
VIVIETDDQTLESMRVMKNTLRLLGQGGTVAALAQSAAYSEREIHRLLAGIYRRLGASNRTDALLRAERWGLLDDD